MPDFEIVKRIVEVAPDRLLVSVTAVALDASCPAEHMSRYSTGLERAEVMAIRMEDELRDRMRRKGHSADSCSSCSISRLGD